MSLAPLMPYLGEEDPDTLFEIIDEIAVGSFGAVYRVKEQARYVFFSAYIFRVNN